MGYDIDAEDKYISGKKLAILFGLVFFAAFIFLQVIFGFPLRDLFKPEVIEEVPVLLKDDSGTCVVETKDHSRTIPNCPYTVGQQLIVTYRQDAASLSSHKAK